VSLHESLSCWPCGKKKEKLPAEFVIFCESRCDFNRFYPDMSEAWCPDLNNAILSRACGKPSFMPAPSCIGFPGFEAERRNFPLDWTFQR
jgi:hypothetical protein